MSRKLEKSTVPFPILESSMILYTLHRGSFSSLQKSWKCHSQELVWGPVTQW